MKFISSSKVKLKQCSPFFLFFFFFWTTSSVQMPFSFFSEFDQLSFLKSFQERTSGTQEVMHLVCLAETLSLEKVE